MPYIKEYIDSIGEELNNENVTIFNMSKKRYEVLKNKYKKKIPLGDNMNIDIDKIKEIYGIEIINLIKENIKDVVKNINYLEKLGFTDTIDIFERFPLLFIEEPEDFSNKIKNLIDKLGSNYVDIVENNLGVLEELL